MRTPAQTILKLMKHFPAMGLLGLSAAAMQTSYAQEPDVIVSDRPDFVNSAVVIGASRFQLETGVAVERNRDKGRQDRTVTTPTLLRFGLSNTLELRLESAGRIRFRGTDTGSGPRTREDGYGDLAVGVKWQLGGNQGLRPATALLAVIDADTGSAPFRGNDLRPSVQLPAEWALSNTWGVALMPGIRYDKDEAGRRFYNGMFGVVLGKAWTERFRTFAEVAAPQIAGSRHGGTIATLDVGAAYLLSNRWQIDAALYKGLNDNTADLAATIGVSVKF